MRSTRPRSKTRSSSSAPPEPIFFVDRDLGRRFVEALRETGIAVEAHDDHFRADTPDEEWIQEVADRGWVALTHDAKIRYTSRARAVVVERGARLIVIKGKVPVGELARSFALSQRVVGRFLARNRAPFIAKFYRNATNPGRAGRLEIWI